MRRPAAVLRIACLQTLPTQLLHGKSCHSRFQHRLIILVLKHIGMHLGIRNDGIAAAQPRAGGFSAADLPLLCLCLSHL